MANLESRVICREDPELVKQETYAIEHLVEKATEYDIDLQVIRPRRSTSF